jgi:hypothetical protein
VDTRGEFEPAGAAEYGKVSQNYDGSAYGDTGHPMPVVLVSPPSHHNDQCCGGTRHNITTNESAGASPTSYWDGNKTVYQYTYTVTEWSSFFHNNAHYDDSYQVCCNVDHGYPSTRMGTARYRPTYDTDCTS